MFDTEDLIQKGDVAFLDAGIHEDVELTSIRNEKGSNGNRFIEFTFTKNGSSLKHTEWEVTNDRGTLTSEQVAAKNKNQLTRIVGILSCFYDKDSLKFKCDTFEELANWVVSLVNAADKTIKLRIKAVYGKNNYVTLPSYGKYTFIEPMTVKESKIRELSIDNFTRPETGDAETQTESAANTFQGSGSNDTPF